MFARPWSGRHHIAAPDYDAGDFIVDIVEELEWNLARYDSDRLEPALR